ncbi:MAG: anthranilate synthase component 1 [Verrucomicrobiales bacterium]|jgi:anthranilate synthase component 1
MTLPLHPSQKDFQSLVKRGNVVPVYAELTADYETPIAAFEKVSKASPNAFLFESAESSDQIGRFSFMGIDPKFVFTARGREIEIFEGGKTKTQTAGADSEPLAVLETLMGEYQPVEVDGLPVFSGGAVGYLSYDMVRFFEPTVSAPPKDELGLPDMVFLLADTLIIFDHRFRRLQVVANAFIDEHKSAKAAYESARRRIKKLVELLSAPLESIPLATFRKESGEPEFDANTTQAEYEKMVEDAKEFIHAGDIFQVVPSQRFEVDFDGSPLDLYRALRHINPSPYMFCMNFEHGFSIVGSSPEVHVRSIDGKIEIRPIAGTRWRGKTEEEDQALADDLLADPKERAEHIMLVDLARNDVGRVAEYESVKVTDFMIIERYSHVMHIVSNVEGTLNPDFSAYDVMRATFPAGTVSGSPKVRAMQIINDFEKSKRCAYAGAVGYFGFDGNHDSCIALRTAVMKDGKVYIQAGAGVVADSVPENEYVETLNKAKGLMRAVEHARSLSQQREELKES